MKRYGLALSGGGTKGAAHAGVLLALKEEKLLPDAIAGTSAGSLVAGCFACGMEPEELCEEVRYLSEEGPYYLQPDLIGIALFVPQLLGQRNVSLSGLLKDRRLNRYFCRLTGGRAVREVPFPLLIPAVDIRSGDTICFTNMNPDSQGTMAAADKRPDKNSFKGTLRWEKRGILCDAMMASSSVPGIFRPKEIFDYCLVDGGVTDNLPVNLMLRAGIRNVVGVDVGTVYQMPENENVFEILTHSFAIMSGSLKDCRSVGEKLLLKPVLSDNAGLLDFESMERCMEEAYRYTKANAGRIRAAVRA